MAGPCFAIVAAQDELPERPKHDLAARRDRQTACKAQARLPLVRHLFDHREARAAIAAAMQFAGRIKGK